MVSMYPVLWRSLLRGTNEIDNKLGCLFHRPPRRRMHCSVGLTDHDGSGPLSQSNDAKLWNALCRSPMVTVTLNSLVNDNYRRVDGKEFWRFSLQFSAVQNVCCTAAEHLVLNVASHMDHANNGHRLQAVYFYLRLKVCHPRCVWSIQGIYWLTGTGQ